MSSKIWAKPVFILHLDFRYAIILKQLIFAGVAEWQTHQTQNLTGATPCGFKSHRPQAKDIHSAKGEYVFYFAQKSVTCSTSTTESLLKGTDWRQAMGITVREFTCGDIPAMIKIWNEVVEDGVAFPQTEPLEEKDGRAFFESQSFTGVAAEQGKIVGFYILHPNNVGRCGHISNASYAVKGDERGKKIGELLVLHCIAKAREIGFKILQFNAVVSTNTPAIRLYEKLGFVRLGVIPGGFLLKDGSYQDIIPHYYVL